MFISPSQYLQMLVSPSFEPSAASLDDTSERGAVAAAAASSGERQKVAAVAAVGAVPSSSGRSSGRNSSDRVAAPSSNTAAAAATLPSSSVAGPMAATAPATASPALLPAAGAAAHPSTQLAAHSDSGIFGTANRAVGGAHSRQAELSPSGCHDIGREDGPVPLQSWSPLQPAAAAGTATPFAAMDARAGAPQASTSGYGLPLEQPRDKGVPAAQDDGLFAWGGSSHAGAAASAPAAQQTQWRPQGEPASVSGAFPSSSLSPAALPAQPSPCPAPSASVAAGALPLSPPLPVAPASPAHGAVPADPSLAARTLLQRFQAGLAALGGEPAAAAVALQERLRDTLQGLKQQVRTTPLVRLHVVRSLV